MQKLIRNGETNRVNYQNMTFEGLNCNMKDQLGYIDHIICKCVIRKLYLLLYLFFFYCLTFIPT